MGTDWIGAGELKRAPDIALSERVAMYNKCLRSGTLPVQLTGKNLVPGVNDALVGMKPGGRRRRNGEKRGVQRRDSRR